MYKFHYYLIKVAMKLRLYVLDTYWVEEQQDVMHMVIYGRWRWQKREAV